MEALKHVQSVLRLPELKVFKFSDTRWLSHERCVRAILKELPPLITTLHQLYEDAGDAEAYGLALALSTYSEVATIVLLASVLDLLAKRHCFMQRKATDFSKLPVILETILSELKHLKSDEAEWCSLTGTTVIALEEKYNITLRSSYTRCGNASATTMSEY